MQFPVDITFLLAGYTNLYDGCCSWIGPLSHDTPSHHIHPIVSGLYVVGMFWCETSHGLIAGGRLVGLAGPGEILEIGDTVFDAENTIRNGGGKGKLLADGVVDGVVVTDRNANLGNPVRSPIKGQLVIRNHHQHIDDETDEDDGK